MISPSDRRPQLLIVDDNCDLAENLQDIFEPRGYVVRFTPSAQSRIYRLERSALAEAHRWMETQLALLSHRFDALEAHLDVMKERGD